MREFAAYRLSSGFNFIYLLYQKIVAIFISLVGSICYYLFINLIKYIYLFIGSSQKKVRGNEKLNLFEIILKLSCYDLLFNQHR